MRYLTLLTAILGLALAGCTGDAPTGAPDAPDGREEPSMGIDPQLEPFVSQAREDLARRLEIDKTEITVIDAGFVTWPNSALGCPEPDMMYTQALVPGYRIRLRADGALHHYHGAEGRPPGYCPTDRVTEPAAASADSKDVS
ncbi:MAG TPA: hypothetical protein VJ908_13820 [Wenzhouxiangellaceae bacterium]|nr:hypothetical protein [Wenzhouxiangellaceae bacterium]